MNRLGESYIPATFSTREAETRRIFTEMHFGNVNCSINNPNNPREGYQITIQPGSFAELSPGTFEFLPATIEIVGFDKWDRGYKIATFEVSSGEGKDIVKLWDDGGEVAA